MFGNAAAAPHDVANIARGPSSSLSLDSMFKSDTPGVPQPPNATVEDRWRYELTQPRVDLTGRDLLKQPLSPAELTNVEAHAWANNEPLDYREVTPRVPLGVGDYWGAAGQGSDRDRAYQQSYENITVRVATDEQGRERLQRKFPSGGTWENVDEFRLSDGFTEIVPPLKPGVSGQSAFFPASVPDDEVRNLVSRFMPRLGDTIRLPSGSSGSSADTVSRLLSALGPDSTSSSSTPGVPQPPSAIVEDRWRYNLTQPKVDLTGRDLTKQPLNVAELEILEAHAWANNEPLDYREVTPRVPLGVGDYWGAAGQGSDRDRAYQQSYENSHVRVATDEQGRERLQRKFPGGGTWENLDEFRLWDGSTEIVPPLKQSVSGQSAFFPASVPDDEIQTLRGYMPRLGDTIHT
jgi:uncharacterized membrane-anchored protein